MEYIIIPEFLWRFTHASPRNPFNIHTCFSTARLHADIPMVGTLLRSTLVLPTIKEKVRVENKMSKVVVCIHSNVFCSSSYSQADFQIYRPSPKPGIVTNSLLNDHICREIFAISPAHITTKSLPCRTLKQRKISH